MNPVPSHHGSAPETRRTDYDPFAAVQPPPPPDPDRERPGMGRRVLPLALVALLAGGASAATVVALDDSGSPPTSVVEVSSPAAVEPATTGAAAATAGSNGGTRAVVQPAAGAKTINEIYEEAGPGVVRVEQENGQGSGFVIDEDGYVVTNAHVVAGAHTVYVSFSNNDRVEARVVGSDPATDVALLKVDVPSSALTPIPLGESDGVQVGDGVVAIGNPFGLDRTVTSGIVSAISREIPAPNGITAIRDAIQTDAAINHGNSGGPLLDLRGRVIGVTSQIETGGTSEGNVGIGFAIPVDLVKDIVGDLRDDGTVKHAWLGVSLSPVDDALAQRVKLGAKEGAMVRRVVEGGPAANASLHQATDQVVINGETYAIGGDVIVSVDGKTVKTIRDVQDAVVEHDPGDVITLGVVRADGSKGDVKVKLGDLPESSGDSRLFQP